MANSVDVGSITASAELDASLFIEGMVMIDDTLKDGQRAAKAYSEVMENSMARVEKAVRNSQKNISAAVREVKKAINDSLGEKALTKGLGEMSKTMEAGFIRISKTLDKMEVTLDKMKNQTRGVKKETEGWLGTSGSLFNMYTKLSFKIFLIRQGLSQIRDLLDLTGAMRGIESAAQVENLKIGMAGILASTTTLEGKQTSYNEALKISSAIMKRMEFEAVRTTLTMEELAESYQTTMAGGLGAGMNLKEVMDLTIVAANAVKSIGLPKQQVIQELRSLVAGGNIRPANDRLAVILGYNTEIINKLRAEGKLYDDLMERMKGFELATYDLDKTWGGMLSNMQDGLNLVTRRAVKGLFDNLKEKISEARAMFYTLQTEEIEVSDGNGGMEKRTRVIDVQVNQETMKNLALLYNIMNEVIEILFNASKIIASAVIPIFKALAPPIAVLLAVFSKMLEALPTFINGLVDLATSFTIIERPLQILYNVSKDFFGFITTNATAAMTAFITIIGLATMATYAYITSKYKSITATLAANIAEGKMTALTKVYNSLLAMKTFLQNAYNVSLWTGVKATAKLAITMGLVLIKFLAVAAVVGSVVYIIYKMADASSAIGKVWDNLKEHASSTWGQIAAWAKLGWAALNGDKEGVAEQEKMIEHLQHKAKYAMQSISNFSAKDAWNEFVNDGKAAVEKIKSILEPALEQNEETSLDKYGVKGKYTADVDKEGKNAAKMAFAEIEDKLEESLGKLKEIQSELDSAYKQGNISIYNYYNKSLEIQTKMLELQIAAMQQKIELTTDEVQKQKYMTKEAKLQAQLANKKNELTIKEVADMNKLFETMQKITLEYDKAVGIQRDGTNLLELRDKYGKNYKLLLLELQAAQTVYNRAVEEGNEEQQRKADFLITSTTEAIAKLKELVAVDTIKFKADQAKNKLQGETIDLIFKEAEIQHKVSQGYLSSFDAEIALWEEKQKHLDEYTKAYAEQYAYYMNLVEKTEGAEKARYAKLAAEAKTAFQTIADSFDPVTKLIRNGIKDALSEGIYDFATGEATWKEALSNIGKSIVQTIMKAASESIATDITNLFTDMLGLTNGRNKKAKENFDSIAGTTSKNIDPALKETFLKFDQISEKFGSTVTAEMIPALEANTRAIVNLAERIGFSQEVEPTETASTAGVTSVSTKGKDTLTSITNESTTAVKKNTKVFSDGTMQTMAGFTLLTTALAQGSEKMQKFAQVMQVAMMVMQMVQSFSSIGGIGGKAEGGLIGGTGSGTSDSLLSRLSHGEYVMKASAVRKLGVGYLNSLNNISALPSGVLPRMRFANGGLVGEKASLVTSSNTTTQTGSDGTPAIVFNMNFQSLDPRANTELMREQMPYIKSQIMEACRSDASMRNAVKSAGR